MKGVLQPNFFSNSNSPQAGYTYVIDYPPNAINNITEISIYSPKHLSRSNLGQTRVKS